MSADGGAWYSLSGALARAQYGAVLRIRWQMQWHALRTKRGGFELFSRIVATAFFVCIWLGMGIGFGFAAFQFASQGHLQRLSLLLWPVLLIWQTIPVMWASTQGSGDLALLLRFPVSFGTYSMLYLFLGIFDLASQMGAIVLLAIAIGIGAAKPGLLLWVLPALALFAIFNLLLTRMTLAWIERWLARRRTREVLGLVALAFFLSLQLLNPVIRQSRSWAGDSQIARAARAADSVQRFFPPGLTALAMEAGEQGDRTEAVLRLGEVGLYAAAAAWLLGLRLRAEFRGESLGEAPHGGSNRSAPRMPERSGVQPEMVSGRTWLDGAVGAVLVKEVRYLGRSGVMLFGLLTPLIVLLAAGRSGRSVNGDALKYAFPLAVAFGILPLTRQLCNSLGAEGAGIQLYFLSPTPFRSVMLAKNLLQAGLLGLELSVVSIIAVVRFGWPSPQLAMATFCWLLFAAPANLAAGNVLSITLAYRMTLTRLSREEGSVGNGLLSLLIQVLLFAIGAAIYLPLANAGNQALAVPVFLLMGAGSFLLWRRSLSSVDRMAFGRREALMAILVRRA